MLEQAPPTRNRGQHVAGNRILYSLRRHFKGEKKKILPLAKPKSPDKTLKRFKTPSK
jgi:hypothetical protein